MSDDRVAGVLDKNELVVATGWAYLPVQRREIDTFAPLATLIRLGYAFVDQARIGNLRKASAAAGFPLDRHMALMLTSHRLVVWRASRLPRRRKSVLGERPVSQIEFATLPPSSSSRWSTVVIKLAGGLVVRFNVETSFADRLVRAYAADR